MLNLHDIHTRLTQEMARAEQQYDEAHSELRDHREKMSAEVETLTATIESLRAKLSPLFDGAKLTPAVAGGAMKYIAALGRLQRVRQAKRLAFTKGKAIGDVQD